MKIRKKIIVFILALVLMAALAACSTSSSMSYTFNIENGDKVEVKLDTSDGCKISQENGTFTVSGEDDIILAQGSFLLADDTNWQILLDELNFVDVSKTETIDNDEYIYYSIGENAYFCAIRLNGCDSGVNIVSTSEEYLEKALSLLNIEPSE